MSKLSSAFNMIAIGKPACPGTCSHELHCSIDTITPPVVNELLIIMQDNPINSTDFYTTLLFASTPPKSISSAPILIRF